mgnify:CR=1 FL=1
MYLCFHFAIINLSSGCFTLNFHHPKQSRNRVISVSKQDRKRTKPYLVFSHPCTFAPDFEIKSSLKRRIMRIKRIVAHKNYKRITLILAEPANLRSFSSTRSLTIVRVISPKLTCASISSTRSLTIVRKIRKIRR